MTRFFAAALLLAALDARGGKPMRLDQTVEKALRPAFEKLPRPAEGLGYELLLTPFFPTAWPPKGGLLVAYAYGCRHDPDLRDAVRVAPLWAEVKVDPRSPGRPRLTRLADSLGDAETQGVRPLAEQELAALETRADFAGHSSIPKGPAAERMRAYYCAWRRTNGVAAGMVEPRQRAFFAWLACDGAAAP